MTNKYNSRASVGMAFATQYTELVLQFAAVLVLARILSPEDTGTYSIAAFLMTLLHVFRDFGVMQYVIQARELTREQMQNAMGVAILLALLVAGALLACSGLVADFYGNRDIERVLWVMSASFAISPFGSVLLAIMRREAQLQAIFYIRTASTVCHVAVSITLALRGHGALSLAWANFAGILAFGLMANLLRPAGIPRTPRFNDIRGILSFGGMSSLGNAANMAGTNIPDLVIGKVMNMAAVGYFSRATGLVQLFTRLISGALTPLVLPYFAHVRRQGEDIKPSYMLAVEQLTALSWPFFAGLALLAYPMMHTLYGPQWDASVPVVRLLCVAGAIASVSLFATQAMVANGHVRSSTLGNLISQPVRVLAVVAAAAHGLVAVAGALIVSEAVALAVTTWFLRRSIGVRPRDLLRACRNSAVVTACAAVAPLLVWRFWPAAGQPWAPLLAGIAGAALGWMGSIFALRHPLAEHIAAVLQTVLARLGLGHGGLRSQVKALAYHAGLLGAYHRLRNRDQLTVTMFHRVLPRSDPRHAGADPEWTLTPESFLQCLRFFRRHYAVVTPEQVFAALRGGAPLPRRAMLITFDDGWADTAEFAQPLLDREGMRALVFVVGDAVDRGAPFWEEYLYSLLTTDPAGWSKLAQRMADCAMAPLEAAPPLFNTEAAVRGAIADLGRRERPAVLAMVAGMDTAAGQPAMLTRQQLASLVAAGHAIGGHGMTHQPLTRVPELGRELREAQAALAALLRRPVIESMSFPHGAHSRAVVEHCGQVGYRYLFNSEAHLNTLDGPAGQGGAPAQLGRIHISEREITDSSGRVQPNLLAVWLFLRPARKPAGGGSAA